MPHDLTESGSIESESLGRRMMSHFPSSWNTFSFHVCTRGSV